MKADHSLNLRNIGPDVEQWLERVGITSKAQFLAIGAHKIYLLILDAGHTPDDELRCRLLGAEQDVDWHIIAKRDQTRAASRFADIDEP